MEQKSSSPAVLNTVYVFRQVSAVLGIAGSTPLASERPLSRRVPLPSAGGEQKHSAAWWARAARATRGCWGGSGTLFSSLLVAPASLSAQVEARSASSLTFPLILPVGVCWVKLWV